MKKIFVILLVIFFGTYFTDSIFAQTRFRENIQDRVDERRCVRVSDRASKMIDKLQTNYSRQNEVYNKLNNILYNLSQIDNLDTNDKDIISNLQTNLKNKTNELSQINSTLIKQLENTSKNVCESENNFNQDVIQSRQTYSLLKEKNREFKKYINEDLKKNIINIE